MLIIASEVRKLAVIARIAGLVEHAREELNRLNQSQETSISKEDLYYQNLVNKNVMELIEALSKQGHSGLSIEWVRDIFNKLSKYETLTPITDNPKEWSDDTQVDNMWQNKRNPSLFSNDHGKTYWNVDDKKKEIKKSEK